MTLRYMLGTNMVRQVVSGRSANALAKIQAIPANEICVSVVTYAKSMFGLRRQPKATAIAWSNERFYAETEVLPYTTATAETYGQLRAEMENMGRPLGPLDMLIAAHALSVGATLVTSDRAFRFVPGLRTEDWTLPAA